MPTGPAARIADPVIHPLPGTGAAGGADIHLCLRPLPLPPHGPGVVVNGPQTVLINGLSACRVGDTIVEALGPPNLIAMGLPTVIIGG